MRGRSTHNQHIERLWCDIWRGVTNIYHNLFNFLESEHIVVPDNEMHIWALYYVYLPRINRDLDAFTLQWNNQGLWTERHQSPLQIFVCGCLEQQGRATTAMQELFGAAAAPAPMAEVAGGTPAAERGGPGRALLVDWPERVTVPQTQFTLNPADMEQLVAQYDPLCGPRTQLGINLIRDVVSFLESKAQH